MVELHEHLAGLYLRIGDHLGHVVDRRRRDARRRQRADNLRLGTLTRPALDDGGDLVSAVAPRRRRGESGIAREVAAADDLAEPAPHGVARPGGDRHVAVARRIDARARPAERDVAGILRGRHPLLDAIALALYPQ